ncbi:hypothetical protein AA14337_3272 [Acetobacter malorum DSM 14337]|uniref:Transglycosylase SLT domain-containing protein n=3 Tax=Acetobacter malorum TaxID=178901 RepID=A0ABQ0Q0P2_9PROT|nr:hypothetical protein [Acetobacter malorum]GBQ86247.1 hypothetical protein AA14337_3272 [Acetobacter malorum DSM 14337]
MMKLINENEIEALRGKMPLLAGFLSKAARVSVPEGADFKAFLDKAVDGAKRYKATTLASGLAIVGICAATPIMVLDPHNTDHLFKRFVSLDFPSASSPLAEAPNAPPSSGDVRQAPPTVISKKALRDLATNAREKAARPPPPAAAHKAAPLRHIHRSEVSPRLIQAIEHAHAVTGMDRSILGTFAFLESSLNQHTATARSSAEGAFQFTKQAWLDTVSHYGRQHSRGLALAADHIAKDDSGHLSIDQKQAGRFIYNLRDNLAVSATLAADAMKHNQSILEEKFGTSSPTALYAFHLLGPTAAIQFLRAEERGGKEMCSDVLKSGLSANREIFTRDGHDITVAEAYEKINNNVTVAHEMMKDIFPENPRNMHVAYEEPAPPEMSP